METFPIVPGPGRLLWMAVPIFLVLLAAAGALAYSFSAARTARFEVSSAGLRLRGDFYGRFIPAAALDLRGARAVNLAQDGDLAPVARLMGTAIGGYRAGWFRLRDGERALLYVTDRTRVAYVPTTQGYAVLVSVADPNALIAALKRQQG